jgi:hypothetical protein
VPIEELLFNNSLSSNRKVVYVDKGFHRLHLVNRTNRKVFRLILCAPVKTIANKHEIWMLRAIEGVEISDSLDVRSAFAPKPSAKSRHMPSVPRVIKFVGSTKVGLLSVKYSGDNSRSTSMGCRRERAYDAKKTNSH